MKSSLTGFAPGHSRCSAATTTLTKAAVTAADVLYRSADFPMCEIVEVNSAALRRAFIDFPWCVQASDPAWVPPLKREVRRFIDRRHPFFEHGAATFFLAMRDGQPVGRISVSDDPRCNEAHDTNIGCFGMFECIDDQGVANALLEAAAEWLAQRGRTVMHGPVDYSTNYPCGLLIEGFDTPPRVLMNHNPPYYRTLLERAGLTKAKDLYAWWFDQDGPLEQIAPRLEQLAERFRIRIRSLQKRQLAAELERCRSLYNEVWQDAWQSVPFTEAEFQEVVKNLGRVTQPDMALLAEVDGQPVGIVILIPDVNEAIAPLNGRLTTWGLPIGLARLFWRLPRVKTARLAVLGVQNGYRRRGVAELLILQVMRNGKNAGFRAAELSWTLEDNTLVNQLIQRAGGIRYKTYRVFERPIGI